MELTVLGASGSYPTAESACSGYLLRRDGFTVWMDAGNGTLKELQRHVGIREVDAILLSHVHPDHCADLYPFFFAILFPEPERRIPIFTPPGVRERLAALIGDDSKRRWREYMDWRELTPGSSADVGPLRVEMFDAAHSVENNTMRISAAGSVLCYSGDTGPNEHLATAAADADVFLCESSWSNEQKGIMEPIHLTAGEAGRAAAAAGCARLLLTHIWADNDFQRIGEQAADHYHGPIGFAASTGTVTL